MKIVKVWQLFWKANIANLHNIATKLRSLHLCKTTTSYTILKFNFLVKYHLTIAI